MSENAYTNRNYHLFDFHTIVIEISGTELRFWELVRMAIADYYVA